MLNLLLHFVLYILIGFCITFFLLKLLITIHEFRWRRQASAERKRKQEQQEQESENKEQEGGDAKEKEKEKQYKAAVIVCGDIARSPRMQYHAVSLCDHHKEVYIVGANMNNRCCEKLEQHKSSGKAKFCLVNEDEKSSAASSSSGSVGWARRVIDRVFSLFFVYGAAIKTILNDKEVCVVIVQTPPVIPTLPLVALISFCENAARSFSSLFSSSSSENSIIPPLVQTVFDVHNLGWTILKAEKRPKLFVFAYRVLEFLFVSSGYFSSARITVAGALGQHLRDAVDYPVLSSGASKVVVMPDSAPEFFRPASRKEFVEQIILPSSSSSSSSSSSISTTTSSAASTTATAAPKKNKIEFGSLGNNIPTPEELLDNSSSSSSTTSRVLMIAASTSWTADDDYTVVVEALKKSHDILAAEEQSASSENNKKENKKKKLWLFVSGKGPSRHVFESQLKEAKLDQSEHVVVTTGYFQSFSDYALFLGAADLGLCMHHSSSGLDLPMKAVDMFGAGLPICALHYEPALKELVSARTGWMFDGEDKEKGSRTLSSIWTSLLEEESRTRTVELEKKKENVRADRKFWLESWQGNVLPLVRELCMFEKPKEEGEKMMKKKKDD